uniref:Uncharacterized protein n=1 Tax=Anguilla anguilla TaxID=7936 RepID=A0A0E9W6J2_ANGAN
MGFAYLVLLCCPTLQNTGLN